MASSNVPVIVVIMGVSGAGKTTIGQRLEKEIKYKYLDADDFHSQSSKDWTILKVCRFDFLENPKYQTEITITNVLTACILQEKMRMGIPLTDEDRMPWLESLRDAIKESLINKKGLVLGCSALKKQYREILRSGDPEYKLESYASVVNFILLDAPAEVLIARLNKRAAEGKHYMPASLLQSQLDLLNIDESEGILRVDATLSPESIVNSIKEMHPFQGCFKS